MISFLPTIYPDELVYSWFCRYYVHSGCLTHTTALNDILLKRCHNPSKEFIGHINQQAQKKIEEVYSMEYLILQHTMFPQYARFIPLEQKKKAMYHLQYDFCDTHHLFAVLPRVENDFYLKYCPLCVQEDRKKYGETYWHRKHQIRNMNSCYKHRCLLECSTVTAKSEQTFTFCSAEEYVKTKTPQIANTSCQKFSEYMAAVFDSVIDFEKDIPINAVLHYAMADTKYMKSTGKTKYTKQLSDDMQVYYTKMGLSDIASITQIQRHWVGDRFDFSVICQIAYFIGMDIKDLINPSLTMEQIETERNIHYMKDKQPIEWEVFDNEISPKLERLAKSIYEGTASESGRPERVSEKLVYRQMQLEGHRLEKMPKCRAIVQKYTEPYEENWARRIIWAYHKLKSECNPFYWTDIRKISGVKKKNIEKVIPYIYKHTNKATANKIIMIVK